MNKPATVNLQNDLSELSKIWGNLSVSMKKVITTALVGENGKYTLDIAISTVSALNEDLKDLETILTEKYKQ